MAPSPLRLKRHLDALRTRYEHPGALALDPLAVVLDYPPGPDREVAAFVAAHLAYGRVEPMLRAIRAALAPLGPTPAGWLREHPEGAARKALAAPLAGWVWRFHTGPDLVAWLLAWRRLDRRTGGGLEPLLAPSPGGGPDEALSRLVHTLRGDLPGTPGLRFNLPDPLAGAACKRWRMFLRWMVRPGWPDLGQWRALAPRDLVIPLDTHVARVSRYLGLSRRATPDGRMAGEITAALARLDPADPLAYDFALSHLGILGDCPGLRTSACRPCALYSVCRAGLAPGAP